jgi:hemerythrin-like domain-containing protein
MARRGKGSRILKWGLISGAVAGGAALVTALPAVKNRAMRATMILKKDHRIVSGLIMSLEMAPRINGMVRRSLLNQIKNLLMVHTQAEEEILYPSMRNLMMGGNQSMVDEAYHEHQQVKDLLNDLSTMDPLTDAFDRKVEDLKNKIMHHVEEEEGEMFEILKQRMSSEEELDLGRRIHDRKMDLKSRMAA